MECDVTWYNLMVCILMVCDLMEVAAGTCVWLTSNFTR